MAAQLMAYIGPVFTITGIMDSLGDDVFSRAAFSQKARHLEFALRYHFGLLNRFQKSGIVAANVIEAKTGSGADHFGE